MHSVSARLNRMVRFLNDTFSRVLILVMFPAAAAEETCQGSQRYRRMYNVSLETNLCTTYNFPNPVPSSLCTKVCQEEPQVKDHSILTKVGDLGHKIDSLKMFSCKIKKIRTKDWCGTRRVQNSYRGEKAQRDSCRSGQEFFLGTIRCWSVNREALCESSAFTVLLVPLQCKAAVVSDPVTTTSCCLLTAEAVYYQPGLETIYYHPGTTWVECVKTRAGGGCSKCQVGKILCLKESCLFRIGI